MNTELFAALMLPANPADSSSQEQSNTYLHVKLQIVVFTEFIPTRYYLQL